MAGLTVFEARVIEPGLVPRFGVVTPRALTKVVTLRSIILEMTMQAIAESRMIKLYLHPVRGVCMTLHTAILKVAQALLMTGSCLRQMSPGRIGAHVMIWRSILLMARLTLHDTRVSEIHRLPGLGIMTIIAGSGEVIGIYSSDIGDMTRFTLSRRIRIFAIGVTLITCDLSMLPRERITVVLDVFAQERDRDGFFQFRLRRYQRGHFLR
jgi:hypothetical protein